MPPKRMTANPVRPARYRAGKAVAEVETSEEEDSDSEEVKEEPEAREPPPKVTSFPSGAGKPPGSNLKSVDLAERKRQAEVAERKRLADEKVKREKEERDAGFVTESESEVESDSQVKSESSEDEDSDEEDSSEAESDSSDDKPARPLMRPIFVPKSQRKVEHSTEAAAAREEERYAEEEARRKEEADFHVKDQMEKTAAARRAGKQNYDDDDLNEDEFDDTDDINPELEHKAWIVRELTRIKRARAAIEEREREIEELERRQNLTAAEREAEDREHVAKQQEERKGRGQMAHLQKYFHKGAFFADDAEQQGLLNRDLMGARFEDQQTSREQMPEYLQVRDATKIGKKGRTRYKDMKSEDTGRWGDHLRDDRRPYKGGSGFEDVTDERYKPDSYLSREGATGANAGPLGERKRTGPVDETNDAKRTRYD